MIRRILTIVLIVLGVGTIGAAIASATVWKPDTVVTVPLPQEPAVEYVVTEPGVLNIVNETVKIHVKARDGESPVFLAMGRTDDVEAWVAPSDHGQITGLDDWDALAYRAVDGVVPEPAEDEGDAEADEDAEDETPANPADSDMWVEEVNGVGELTYTWDEIPGRWSMLVATDGSSPAPMVELTWEREVPTPALIPGIILGALLFLIGLGLLAAELIGRRKNRDQPELIPARTDVDEASPEETSPEEIMARVEAGAAEGEPLPSTTDLDFQPGDDVDETYPHLREGPAEELPAEEEPPLTRREIRERERARERAEALAGGADDAETSTDGAGVEPKRRRWWNRRQEPLPAAAPGPIVIDEDTGEIIITGEIDVSNLNPQATGASWRATWGLDNETPSRWIPVMEPVEESEPSDEG